MTEIVNSGIQAVLGGVTGYVTNNLAIKMLFKKYWKFGGVIEETREEFIENISKLIEKDLVNHNTLLPEIEKEKFQKAVFEVIKDMISLYLPRNSGDMKIGEIQGIDKTKQNFVEFINNEFQEIEYQIKNLYLKKELNQIISEKQFNYIVLEISNKIVKNIDSYLEQLLESGFEVLKDTKVEEILSEINSYQIENNLKEIIEKTETSKLTPYFEEFLDEVEGELGLDKIIKEKEEQLNNLTLKEINNIDISSNQLAEQIITIIRANPEIIEQFFVSLIQSLKKVDISIYEIFDKEIFKKKLKEIKS